MISLYYKARCLGWRRTGDHRENHRKLSRVVFLSSSLMKFNSVKAGKSRAIGHFDPN
jgi:hypothetical protein